jgi:hypothetical protein
MILAGLRKAQPNRESSIEMKRAGFILAFLLLSLCCAYGQMTMISPVRSDPEVKPEQRTATIVHYEKMRTTARATIRVLVMGLQNTDAGGSRAKLNEAIDNQQDIVDWANWCIVAVRDRTADGSACLFKPDVR